MSDFFDTNYIELKPSKIYLQGTNFILESGGFYEATTVTCSNGDSNFTAHVGVGDVLEFSTGSRKLQATVKSITSSTVMVVYLDDSKYYNRKRFSRYCKVRPEGVSQYIKREFISGFEKDAKSNVYYLYPSEMLGRFGEFANRNDNVKFSRYGFYSKMPFISYTAADTDAQENDLTVPAFPISKGHSHYRVKIDTVAVAQVTKLTTVADSGGSLDNTYVVIGGVSDSISICLVSQEDQTGDSRDILRNAREGSFVTVEIASGTGANDVATAIKDAVDDLDNWSATVSTNVVTITNGTKGKCSSSYDPIADRTATTISAITRDDSYSILQDSADGFGSYVKGSKIKITTTQNVIDGVYTVFSSSASTIVLEEPFPENPDVISESSVDSVASKNIFSAADLESVTIEAGRTGFTILNDGSSSTVVGANDKFTYSYDGGVSFPVTGREILGDDTINNGFLLINFKKTTGHSLNDYWDILVGPSIFLPVDNTFNDLLGREDDPSFLEQRRLNKNY